MTKKIFGLTGGIGSGKTTLGKILEDNHPEIELFDCDSAAKEIFEDNQVRQKLKFILGDGIEVNNKINFKKIAEIIFNNQEKKAAVEQLIHPKVWQKIDILTETSESKKIILVESAILIDIGKNKDIPNIIATVCGTEEKVRRIKSRNGWTEAEIKKRMDNQTNDKILRKAARVIVDTNCSLDQLKLKAETVYKYLISPTGEKLSL